MQSVNNVISTGTKFLNEINELQECEETGMPSQGPGFIKSWCGLGIFVNHNESTASFINIDFSLTMLCQSHGPYCVLFQAGLCVLSSNGSTLIDALNQKVYHSNV